jgi:cytochrome c551/c552
MHIDARCSTYIVATWMLASGTLAPTLVAAADAKTLMLDHKCYICHEDGYSKAGPAFVDVAAAYGHDRRAATHIGELIRRGQHGSSPWHMPPHPELTNAEARRIALYILALKPEAAARP